MSVTKPTFDIKIKYFPGMDYELEKISKGDWIDLRSRDRIILRKGESARIRLGVAMQLPEGYEAHIAPRSSTFDKWGIIQTNSVGVVDGSYCGDDDEWCMEVICLEPKELLDGREFTIIQPGDRICQFRVMETQPNLTFTKVDKLNNPNRGGYGSTGTI